MPKSIPKSTSGLQPSAKLATPSREKKKNLAKYRGSVPAKPERVRGKRNRREEALRKLELPEGFSARKISHILEAAEGGIEQAIEALRGSQDDQAAAFIKKYDSISETDLKHLKIEEIAGAAGVDSNYLLGEAVKALNEQGKMTGEVIVVTAMPKLLQKSVQLGLQDRGHSARDHLYRMSGVLPTPNGSNLIFNRYQLVKQFLNEPEDSGKPKEIEVTPELPQFEFDIAGLEDTQKQLKGNVR